MTARLVPFVTSFSEAVQDWARASGRFAPWTALPSDLGFPAALEDPHVTPYLLLEGDAPVGYGELWSESAPDGVELARVVVDPRARRRGVERELVQALVETARARFGAPIRVRVLPDDADALACYAKLGFVRTDAANERRFDSEAQGTERVWLLLPASGDDRAAQPPRDAVAAFYSPAEAARALEKTALHWSVIGGHALDLWLGFASRAHGDLEIALPRDEFGALSAALHPLAPYAVGHGRLRAIEPGAPLPADVHQARFLDAERRVWRLDVMVDPGDGDTWVYRRDEQLRCPRASVTARRDGIPYLHPEVVLLFKAKACREKDERDFALCVDRLDPEARSWLLGRIERFYPGHRWASRSPSD